MNGTISASTEAPKRLVLYASDPAQFRRYEALLHPAKDRWVVVPAYRIGRGFVDDLKIQSADGVLFHFKAGETAVVETLQALTFERPDLPRFVICSQKDRSTLKIAGGLPPVMLLDDATAEEFDEALTRTYLLGRWLLRPELRQILPKIQALPTIAGTYQQLIEALQDPEYSADKVGNLIARDPSLTAQILKVVNSAYFGLSRPVQAASEAVTVLGASRLQALIMASRAFSFITENVCRGFSPARELEHALAVAGAAMELAREAELRGSQSEAVFTAAMLHDLGKLLLAANLTERYAAVLADAQARKVPVWDAEKQALGFSHAELGACLLGVWGLSLPIIAAVAWHHTPAEAPEPTSPALLVIHIANCRLRNEACDPAAVAALGLDPAPAPSAPVPG